MQVLIIEDNSDLAGNLWEHLESRGHIVDAAGDGITGLHLATVNDYEVIVLDLTLPGMGGLDVCRRLRNDAGKSTPVLMLTARDTLQDKLTGFESGADDYLVKPFELQELEARLEALTRRAGASLPRRVLRFADLTLDIDAMRVTRAGHDISLTPTGLKILELLMRQPRRVVTRRALEKALWGDMPPNSDALRAHIHTLRVAVDKPFQIPLIQTVRGIGFRLADPDGTPA